MIFPELQTLEGFDFVSRLGHGYSSDVSLYKRDGQLVAIKFFTTKSVTSTQAKNAYDNELALLTKLRGHPNVVQVLGYGFQQRDDFTARRPRKINQYFLILEYIKGPNIGDQSLTMPQRKQYFKQLMEVLLQIHKMGVVHKDLTPANIMIKEDQVVLIDFTFGCCTDGTMKMSEYFGTKPFVAPEIIDGAPYYPYPTEVYSLGVILAHLSEDNEIDDKTQNLIKIMTETNSYKRPSLEECIGKFN